MPTRISLIFKILSRCVDYKKIKRRGEMSNRLEGYARLKEEFDKLWEATKDRKHFDSTSCIIELIATSILYLNDLATDDGLARLEFAYSIRDNVECE